MKPIRGPVADVRVLGQVVLTGPQGQAALPGMKSRTLLALLALNAGQVIAYDKLIDALYGEEPPRTALRSLHSHISRVRHAGFISCHRFGDSRAAGKGRGVRPEHESALR